MIKKNQRVLVGCVDVDALDSQGKKELIVAIDSAKMKRWGDGDDEFLNTYDGDFPFLIWDDPEWCLSSAQSGVLLEFDDFIAALKEYEDAPEDDTSNIEVQAELDESISALNNIRKDICSTKSLNPELKMGYSVSYGGILNAYRECDLTFNEAVVELSKLGDA